MVSRKKLAALTVAMVVMVIAASLVFLAIRPINSSPEGLVLETSEMPAGWRILDALDSPAPWPEGGTYFSQTYANGTVEVGGQLLTLICRFDSCSEALRHFSGQGPNVYNSSDEMNDLGDASALSYATTTIQDRNGTHFGDASTWYRVRIGNVVIEMTFITTGPFTEEQSIRAGWMDDLVVAQCNKVCNVGLLP